MLQEHLPIEKLPFENEYCVEFPFSDVGLEIDQAEVGFFSGTAHIDYEGHIVGLVVDCYVPDLKNPLGRNKRISRYFPVPLPRETELSFRDQIARGLAQMIENGFEPDIRDAVNRWHVDRAEQDWEHPEAAE